MRNTVKTFTMLLAVALIVAALPTLAQEPFTLEQILGAPAPSDLTAANDGKRLVWLFSVNGVRNIWVADAPDFKARQLTSFTEDDGQSISNLTFTPDGNSIVYVHGGAPNSRGEIPNPESDPAGVDRSVWVASVATGEIRKLAKGAAPAIAPDGESVAFIRSGQVWTVSLETNAAEADDTEDDKENGPKPVQLIKARGSAGTLRWSPDGSRLAFASRRRGHGFIGIYDMAAKSITWCDPSVDRDSSSVWSPDGNQVAFIRIPVATNYPFHPRREGEPWSIRVADASTGEGSEVWRAQPGAGSVFRGVQSRDQLFWTANGRLVFPSERDGWTHLYSVMATGGEATLLTPGAFEVEDATLSADRQSMLYNSNQAHIDSRDIWSVPVAGGAPTNLTPGMGIEWSPVPTAKPNVIALLRSDATIPARPALLTGKKVRDIAPETMPKDFPSDKLVAPEQVIFSASDGMQIHGQLFVPTGIKAGERRPAAIFFHGGSRRQMLLGFHYRGYYHRAYAFNQYLASKGYVVLSVNYRSGIGYGMEFREAIDYGAAGGSEYRDVEGAGLYLRSRPDVAPNRIGLWGGSYGGYLTALGLARASDLFAAGVDLHGVHDWNIVIRNFQPTYDAGRLKEAARVAFESSPLASMDTWRSPVLLIHGDDDRNVPFSETIDLVEALRKQGVEFEQLIFPDEVHSFLLFRHWMRAFKASADFFDRKLKR